MADHSNVFADAAAASSPRDSPREAEKTVHLSDPKIEHSVVVGRFLDLAVNGLLSPKATGSSESCTEVARLVEFLRKYECDRLLPQLHMCLLGHLSTSTMGAMTVFALGSFTGSTPLCVAALERACHGPTETKSGLWEDSDGGLERGSPPDPGEMSLALWRLIQPSHAWALTRAWTRFFYLTRSGVGMQPAPRHHPKTMIQEFRSSTESMASAGAS